MALTKAQAALKEAMLAAVASGGWVALDGRTIRWQSPLYAAPKPGPFDRHPVPYRNSVFLTFPSRILGYGCPLTGRTDTVVTFKRAHEVLADPTILFAGYRTPELAEQAAAS